MVVVEDGQTMERPSDEAAKKKERKTGGGAERSGAEWAD